jgi:hypothetical protein
MPAASRLDLAEKTFNRNYSVILQTIVILDQKPPLRWNSIPESS